MRYVMRNVGRGKALAVVRLKSEKVDPKNKQLFFLSLLTKFKKLCDFDELQITFSRQRFPTT